MTSPASPQTPFEIAHLKSPDLAAMKDMLAMFSKAFGEPDTYGAAVPSDAYLARLLDRESFVALAAIKNGAVVGGLVAYELDKFEQERKEIYIYDLAVTEEHRRQGIATALIAQMQEIARTRSGYVIFVQADYGDDPAIALYTKLGTREDVLHFDILPGQAR